MFMNDEAAKDERSVKVPENDSDLVLDLNFVPQWARRPPDAVRFARFDDDAQEFGRKGGRRGDDRGGRRPARDDDRRRARPQPPVPGNRPEQGRDRTLERAQPSPEQHGGRSAESRGTPRRFPSERTDARPAPPPPIPLDVRFLPERKPLSELIRKISSTNRAYPLLDLASLLMMKEGCCFVKLEMQPEARDTVMYQCRLCKTLSLNQEQIEAHVVDDHLKTLFEEQEEAVEPPSGTFVCVAKCGCSGVLLGPPNHHSYAEAVRRLHAEQFAGMDIEVYKRRITVSHNPEDVERWRADASKRMTYRIKAVPDAEAMSWIEAQRHMRQEILPTAISKVRKAVLSEKEAQGVRDAGIRRTLRMEWQDESRFPIHLAFTLRAAFRHRHLHVFKAGQGQGMNFVTAVSPVPLDPNVAIPEIRDTLLYLREHPGCTRKEMVNALRPGADPASEQVKALLQPIHWMVEKGHIIEFFNGTLSVPIPGTSART